MDSIAISALAALLLTAVGLMAQQAQVIFADTEKWKLNGKSVTQGQKVDKDLSIEGSEPGATLTLDCGEWLLSYVCREARCPITVCARNASKAYVTAGKLKLPAFPALAKRDVSSVTAAARAGGSPEDAMLLLDSKGVHWGPALNRVLEGSYCFTLTRLGNEREKKTFKIDWDRSVAPEGTVSVPDLTPGGYRLEKGTIGACTPDPEASPAWVVIASAQQFKAMSGDWKNALNSFEQLTTAGASLAAIVRTRHAVLAGMAESVEHQ